MASNHVLMSSRVLLNFPTYSAKSSSASASLSGPRFSMKADQASISHGARWIFEWDWTHSRMSPSPFPAPSSFKRASGSKPRNLTRCWSVPELYLYSPFFLASVARPLSSIRGRITNPPRRTWKLRGGRWVKSVGTILVFIGERIILFQNDLSSLTNRAKFEDYFSGSTRSQRMLERFLELIERIHMLDCGGERSISYEFAQLLVNLLDFCAGCVAYPIDE